MSGEGKKKALIIGAAGFVGGYLATHLARDIGWKVYATRLPSEQMDEAGLEAVYPLDILQPGEIGEMLAGLRPDYLFHLAAQSSVGLSWEKPAMTAQVNIIGTLNLLEVLRKAESAPRTLLVGSGEEYGFLRPEDVPVAETTLPRPGNIYAVTKNTQSLLGSVYSQAYGLPVVMTRSFTHTGPNQRKGFVVPDFCSQVAEIEAGRQEPVLKVGNLSAKRDFCDVRDVVRAYGLLICKGQPGEVYNIGSGKAMEIAQVLRMILSLSQKEIRVEQDPARMRPSDVPEIQADIRKLQTATGWIPKIPMEQTLQETLAHWRETV